MVQSIAAVGRGLIACCALWLAAPAAAQAHEPDPAAARAFAELVQAYRDKPAILIEHEVVVFTGRGEDAASSEPVRATFRFAPKRSARLLLRDYDIRVGNGLVAVTHASNPDAYVEVSDEDSPYYTLLMAFVDLPFPELALAIGEEDPDEVVMQFHPKAPWARPTEVREEEVEGTKRRRLVLTSDHERVEVLIDPATGLMTSVEAAITGGQLVGANGRVLYRHTMRNTLPAEAFAAEEFTLDPGKRAKVDLLAQLPRRAPAEAAGGGSGALVGKSAPEFALASTEGPLVKLEDHLGRVVVLDFWASWCGPCRQGLPELAKVAEAVKRDGLPAVILPINCAEQVEGDERVALARRVLQELKVALPSLIDEKGVVSAAYGVRGIPATFVVRADGVVHAQHVGLMPDYAEKLLGEIKDAMAALDASLKRPPAEAPLD